jgi:molecular chaperone DnaK
VRVTFNIDADGMVGVVATASGTGSSKEMRVESSSNLSRDEVDELRFDSDGLSGEDEYLDLDDDDLVLGEEDDVTD